MSHLRINDFAKYTDHTDSPKFGEVIYNNDPEKLGRIKVRLKGIFEPTDEIGSNLPWVRQLTDTFLCGNDTELFDVPKVGSIVQIRWAFDTRIPFYTGVPYSKKHKTNSFDNDYPNECGMRIGNFLIKFNKESNTFILTGNSTEIEIDSSGIISVKAPKENIQVETDYDINAKSISMTSTTSIDLEAPMVTISELSVSSGASGAFPIGSATLIFKDGILIGAE